MRKEEPAHQAIMVDFLKRNEFGDKNKQQKPWPVEGVGRMYLTFENEYEYSDELAEMIKDREEKMKRVREQLSEARKLEREQKRYKKILNTGWSVYIEGHDNERAFKPKK